MELEAVVFDFDGVIADTEPLHFRSFQTVLAEEEIDLTEGDYYSRYLGLSDAAAFRTIGVEHRCRWDADRIADLMARKAARFEQLERASSVIFRGADAFVRAASAAVPIAVASGARRAEILRILDDADLTRCFVAIIAAEDVAASKPAPDPYLRSLDALSAAVGRRIVPHRSVAIEDSARGIESARAAGLKTIAIPRAADRTDVRRADLVIDGLEGLTFTDLRDLVAD